MLSQKIISTYLKSWMHLKYYSYVTWRLHTYSRHSASVIQSWWSAKIFDLIPCSHSSNKHSNDCSRKRQSKSRLKHSNSLGIIMIDCNQGQWWFLNKYNLSPYLKNCSSKCNLDRDHLIQTINLLISPPSSLSSHSLGHRGHKTTHREETQSSKCVNYLSTYGVLRQMLRICSSDLGNLDNPGSRGSCLTITRCSKDWTLVS